MGPCCVPSPRAVPDGKQLWNKSDALHKCPEDVSGSPFHYAASQAPRNTKSLQESLARNGPPGLSGAPKFALSLILLSAPRAETKVLAEARDIPFPSRSPGCLLAFLQTGWDTMTHTAKCAPVVRAKGRHGNQQSRSPGPVQMANRAPFTGL